MPRQIVRSGPCAAVVVAVDLRIATHRDLPRPTARVHGQELQALPPVPTEAVHPMANLHLVVPLAVLRTQDPRVAVHPAQAQVRPLAVGMIAPSAAPSSIFTVPTGNFLLKPLTETSFCAMISR